MPEPMRPDRWKAAAQARPTHDTLDQVGLDTAARGAAGHKHGAVLGAGPGIVEVSGQCLAHLDWQWQPLLAAGLAPDKHLTGPPVHVTEFQPCDLSRSQT